MGKIFLSEFNTQASSHFVSGAYLRIYLSDWGYQGGGGYQLCPLRYFRPNFGSVL